MTSKTILLVEDNVDDVFAFGRALKKAGVTNPLRLVADGQQALDYLGGVGDYTDRQRHPVPFLIFLDLKLPYVDGFEILAWMRQQRELEGVVVVILTSSGEDIDRRRAYALGARSFCSSRPRRAIFLRRWIR